MKPAGLAAPIKARAFFWEDMYVFEMLPNSREKSRGLFVCLHGFPAWTTKNYDIAERLCLLGYSVFIPHYPGLGFSPGVFSFRRSIASIRRFLKYIKARHNLPLSLMGHSWGGYVALTLNRHVEDKLLLFAPLSRFPAGKRLQGLINGLFAEAPDDCRRYTKATMRKEFGFLAEKIAKTTAALKLAHKQTLILHGTADAVIPIEYSRTFAPGMGGSAQLIELPEEHLLVGKRKKVFDHVAHWIQNG